MRLRAVWIVMLAALPLAAQEPNPVKLRATAFISFDGVVELTLPWRYAPGDDPRRAAAGFDDSQWRTMPPRMLPNDLRAEEWQGVGWFRRHLLVDPVIQSQTIALRITSPGPADVYLDGKQVLAVGRYAAPEVPSRRGDAVLVRLDGPSHVLAVRYVYPRVPQIAEEGIGFVVAVARVNAAPVPPPRMWLTGVKGALVALPFLLALLHLALFAFDTRARENLFYALEMLSLSVVVLNEYRDVLLPFDWQRTLLHHLASSLPVAAILFGLLTYYALRTGTIPRMWRVLVPVALALIAFCSSRPSDDRPYWVIFFVLAVLEIVRIERSGLVVRRRGAAFFLTSLSLLGVAILLQILINAGWVEAIGGIHEVYIFGILASGVGMSLYLARTLGQSRIVAAENARKTGELAHARDLQLSMLPRTMPQVPGLEIAAATQTAAEVGGDYYDVRLTDDGSLLLAFGDATGHGLAAGIVVTAAKALFTSLAPSEPLPELLATCDRAMHDMQLPALRMCLALARISPRTVAVATAAMPPLLIHRAATGDVEELGANGLPLGTRVRSRYAEASASLLPGDTLLFASDGFAELTDANGRQLGYDGAIDAFRRAATAARCAEVIDRLFAEAARFRGARAQDDDITFVVVRVGRA